MSPPRAPAPHSPIEPGQRLAHVRECSPWFASLHDRHPGWLDALRSSGRLEGGPRADPATLAEAVEVHGLDAGLRCFRNREMMRIAWRELCGLADTVETLTDLSELAEVCIRAAVDHHAQRLAERYGTPRDEDGRPQSLVVLALGKLGGRELNLSSDVDLVLCFPSEGVCDGARSLPAETFFTRVARAAITSLSEVTGDGFCFRVDTRLRPFGQSGPLVASFAAMEQYYQREGRDWERYALIKARPVAGDAGGVLLERLQPFVYRRYIDFGAVEALRDMQARVQADAARRDRLDDIKRGPGGIREIEFMVQAFQLLRGGREPRLRTPSLLDALDAVASLGLMPGDAVDQVRADYCALRDLENRLQAQHDQQVHQVPDGEDLERLARAMRQPDAAALQRWLEQLRERVRRYFEAAHPDERRAPADDAWAARWQRLREDAAERATEGTGDPMRVFAERVQRQALSQRAARRLDRFMPLMLELLAEHPVPDPVLNHVLDLVLAISRRSAYLSLLVHHPDALRAVLQLFEQSTWLASEVVRYPSLLDELIDPALVARPPDQEEIAATVGRTRELGQDLEARLNALNHVKRAFVLRIAVAELRGNLEPVEVPGRLTRVAEAVLQAALELAAEDLGPRHPGLGPQALSVVGYGSLGAAELGYTSDLDLVFLHDAPDEQEAGITLLARRTLSLLTTPTPAGRLYEVDTRLRPNGRAGLLVSSLEAFERYQRESAWTWELQALTRARPVAGDASLGERFSGIRRAVLAQPRDAEVLRTELAEMRARMRREAPGGSPLKHGPGGLVDIEFIAQLGVLANAADAPVVTDASGTRGQLEALGASGWLSPAQAHQLLDVHAALLEARHRAFLAGQPPADVPGREGVINLFSDRVGTAPEPQ